MTSSMSEADVTHIRDEDVLRRMWQQTEDFSKKKEIRAHMYRLREERLRNLYSPEPTAPGKGVESAMHVSSLADQSFQGLKSKEVRDAGSPPKDYCRAPDLKELSNAGWNVQSENRTTDDGHTQIRSVRADVEGRYDVEGGHGRFAAVDTHRQAHTDYVDGNTAVSRAEASSNTAQREQVVNKTDDGTHISSATSSTSSKSSKFQQVTSSTQQVPYITNDSIDRDNSVARERYISERSTNTSNISSNTRDEINTHVINTGDYENNLKRNVHEGGELVSRKVDYPDENTKIIVETRYLPDGTRVTNTRKEFRTPSKSIRSEQHSSKSESNSFSKQNTANVQSLQSRQHFDIVESQKNVDDIDFKRNYIKHQEYTDETLRTDRQTTDSKQVEIRESMSKLTQETTDQRKDVSNTKINQIYFNESSNQNDEYIKRVTNQFNNTNNETISKTVDSNNQGEAKVQEVDQTNIKTTNNNHLHQDVKETQHIKSTEENIRNIPQGKRVEDIIEKTTNDQYQTTYQNDYTQKKVSNDWSPSHQAWASTLRADTPSSTRPTTRASTPGSTSSLRSSVSPDKMSRKPNSRCGSPNKAERSSPSRYISDQLSTTQSTHSVIETKILKHTSPDRKPPTSPSRQRLSQSPDKCSRDYRTSPDRKLTHRARPTDIYPCTVPSQSLNSTPRPSPERQFDTERESSQCSPIIPEKNTSSKSGNQTFKRPSSSPERSTFSPSVGADSKPGYMKPTSSSNTHNSPKYSSPERKSPSKNVPSQNSELNTYGKTTVKEDHYKFIDEETKMYTRVDHSNENKNQMQETKGSSPSPDLFSDNPDVSKVNRRSESPTLRPTLRKDSRSPSPPKGPVTFIDSKNNKLETVNLSTKNADIIYSTKYSQDDTNIHISVEKVTKESSPSRLVSYDKKYHTDEDKETIISKIHDSKYDSLSRRETIKSKSKDLPTKTFPRNSVSPTKNTVNPHEYSPSKYDTYDKRRQNKTKETETVNANPTSEREKSPDSDKLNKVSPLFPTRQSYKESVSPKKSPAKDFDHKHTSEFIATEKKSEEMMKKTNKDHPRQLVTPSTSPTRKPVSDEMAPSTGQSSPTTSVSGFIYFSSPKTGRTVVTDLDDVDFAQTNEPNEESTSMYKRPETLNLERSQSPSKIPCRSPSPGKTISPTKDKLPRKSSLKKTSTGNNLVSPVEKPPSSFRVSPTNEIVEYPEHKIVKKDRPDKPTDSSVKVKPPFERRETYEERCLKILGVVDDKCSNVKIMKNENKTSSISPCSSPTPKESSQLQLKNKTVSSKEEETSKFISQKQVESCKNTNSQRKETIERMSKTPSREASPAKLQDIMVKPAQTTYDKEPTQNPDVDIGYQKPYCVSSNTKVQTKAEKSFDQVKSEKIVSEITTDAAIAIHEYTKKRHLSKDTSPERSSLSPERKSGYQSKTIEAAPSKTEHEASTLSSPVRTSLSLGRKPSYMNTTTSSSKKIEFTRENESTEKITKAEHSRTKIKHSEHTSISPERKPSYREPSPNKQRSELSSTATRISRSPSPTKKVAKTEESTLLVQSEREREILDRVQQSLRKLSPNRERRSQSREKSPGKSSLSLQDIDVVVVEETTTKKTTETKESEIKVKDDKTVIQKVGNKINSRNMSQNKKNTNTSPPKSPDSSNKSRSISPKKPVQPTERPQSPQVPGISGIKSRESASSSQIRKPNQTTTISPKSTASDVKKSTSVTKQNSASKISTFKIATLKSTSTKVEPESKRAPTPKGLNKENFSPKKDDLKVNRTASDSSLKNKKSSPQRMKSKPEIQVDDLSPTRSSKLNPQKFASDTHTKLAPKPKSATALNTPQDDDDIIIDVEQAKSSRETSPDRICPTPVGFSEDVGTPRYPDEVREPDDEFRQRTHQTIHETESIVDDIVEISENEELFTKKTDAERITGSDDCLLSVTDKVSKYTKKIETIKHPKDATNHFKDEEKRNHSDFAVENLKTDECLLSVSEKVNKFAKGLRETKSPARKIIEDFDTDTVYQDDYTKLSVNDKAHLFVETAENVKSNKSKSLKVDRPDMTNVDESLKSDDCLLSVSDKVNKFVKTAEQFLNETRETEERDKIIKEQYDEFIKHITQCDIEDPQKKETLDETNVKKNTENQIPSFAKETTSSLTKVRNYTSPNLKHTERTPTVKITTLRSSEAVKKAKALFENIASTTQKNDSKTTKLLDIGVIKKSPKTDSTTVLHPSVEEIPKESENDSELHQLTHLNEKPSKSSTSPLAGISEVTRAKSPKHKIETVTVKTANTVISRFPAAKPIEKQTRRIPEHTLESRFESEKHEERMPDYQRPTMTSQIKENKLVEETEVSSRRGSGKFGVELRRTSLERSTISSERRRSTDHHQPCIEDIFDLDLLEQMLEKVVGYEQRRRIRAQIRIAKKTLETERSDTTNIKTKQTTTFKTRSPERRHQTKSPERIKSTQQKTVITEPVSMSTPKKTQPDYNKQKESGKPVLNGHASDSDHLLSEKRQRPQSPEKSRTVSVTKSHVRQLSPEKRTRTTSPTKHTPKIKANRFNEYATAYMKKIGLNETDKGNLFDNTQKPLNKSDRSEPRKTAKNAELQESTIQHIEEYRTAETKTTSTSKTMSERTSSRDVIEIKKINGHQARRTPSPVKQRSPERPVNSPDRLYQRTPSPDFKRRNTSSKQESIAKTIYESEPKITKKETVIKTVYEERPKIETSKKETIIKTVHNIEKKVNLKSEQEEKPTWVTNRNLKKISSETRSLGSKTIEEKKSRVSPSKAVMRPTDAITSSYGLGPLDANGRPLFGIKALRNGASNCKVKGTVIRQEFHSHNGSEPEGTVSVTAYSSQPEDLERLLLTQGEKPSRIHGLAAITTTKKFGGETGSTLKEAHCNEERAVLEQFTESERRVSSDSIQTRDMVRTRDSTKDERGTERIDKKTVRQSSVKSLTEKYIKSASDTTKSERTSYPKAGLILRTTTLKDSASSDSSQHAGLGRTNSAHSLSSVEDNAVVTTRIHTDGRATTSTTRTVKNQEKSFLDSSTKVTGVQDILTRMKNADIVIQDGDTEEDSEARALLNKFLGATVLMAGMQAYVNDRPSGQLSVKQETVRTTTSGAGGGKSTTTTSSRIEEVDLDQCWDEKLLRKLLEESTDYEQRRRIRARIRSLMAEQEACASAVTEALAAAGGATTGDVDANEVEEVTVTSSARRNSSEKTVSSTTTTKTSKVIESMSRPAPKPVSPFAKFRQLEKQNSVNSPNSPQTPQSPGSPASYFKFTDPALQASALTIKERLLQWCRDKTRDYENVKLENFSTSWADGLAFCALIHHFLPDAFDYSKLTAERRRHNFTLAFKVADEKAGIYPLLDVDDMVAMRKPDWKCVFTYVQAIHRRFKDQS